MSYLLFTPIYSFSKKYKIFSKCECVRVVSVTQNFTHGQSLFRNAWIILLSLLLKKQWLPTHFSLSYLSPFPDIFHSSQMREWDNERWDSIYCRGRLHSVNCDRPNDLFIFVVLPNMGYVIMLKWNTRTTSSSSLLLSSQSFLPLISYSVSSMHKI